MQDHIRQINESPCDARPDHTYGSSAVLLPNYSFGPLRPSKRTKRPGGFGPLCAKNGLMHCSKQHRYSISSSARASRCLGGLALTVAQNLGIAAERIHDCGRDEFDTR